MQLVLPMTTRLVSAALLAALAASCSKAEDPHFPAGFLFGTAIAGFQAEMGCPTIAPEVCEDRSSDWYRYITDPDLLKDPGLYLAGDPPSSGPGFYELYEADLDRAANDLHSNALRTSIEWSRIFPTSTVGVEDPAALAALANPVALAWYHKLFAAMKARKLTPLVTLIHYTLPSWLHDASGCHKDFAHCTARGWVDKATAVHEAAKYAGFAAREFGGEVDLWATLNEPLTAVVLAGYLLPSADRTNPPGISLHWAEAKTAVSAMIEAHNRMADAVHQNDTKSAGGGAAAQVGIVFNLQAVSPKDPNNATDVAGAQSLSYLMNQMFLDGALEGDVDEQFDGKQVHHADLGGRTDFLGINYYERLTVPGLKSPLFPNDAPVLTANLLSLERAGDVTGISDALEQTRRWGLPVVITETGTRDEADTGPGAAWIDESVTRARRAISAGIDLRGYLYWTLFDNYEWNHGMTAKYGLYAVDTKDPQKKRTQRAKAAAALAAISAQRLAPADLTR
jgi:beta-glucosidase/6-phospho-beta-glucosidase/beta-galactosidase